MWLWSWVRGWRFVSGSSCQWFLHSQSNHWSSDESSFDRRVSHLSHLIMISMICEIQDLMWFLVDGINIISLCYFEQMWVRSTTRGVWPPLGWSVRPREREIQHCVAAPRSGSCKEHHRPLHRWAGRLSLLGRRCLRSFTHHMDTDVTWSHVSSTWSINTVFWRLIIFCTRNCFNSLFLSWLMIEGRKHYAAGSAELRFGGRSTGFKNLDVIFDSGSSYSYFTSQIYHALLTLVSIKEAKTSLNEF